MKKCCSLFVLLLLSACASSVDPAALRTSPVANERWKAAQSIGNEGREDMSAALLQAVRSDPVPLVRAQSAVALGQIGKRNEKIYSTLTSVLKNDPSPLVRQDVIFALRELGYKKATPLITKSLRNSPNADVRIAAADALKTLGTDSYEPLIDGLNGENYRVKSACHRALESLTDRNGPMKSAWWKKKLSSA